MRTTQWKELIIERRGMPPAMSDEHFRDWMTGKPIFISSLMDEEMMSARDAVKAWVRSWDADPVMWEEITPRDQHAEHAYLDGVDRSDLFVLLLGKRYGVRDESGFSPTHKEERRAAERGIVRLLFEPAMLTPSERTGDVNDWVRSLYNEISSAKYSDPNDLVRKLENRLREISSAQESLWIKIGPLIVPGTVERSGGQRGTTYQVHAKLRDNNTRRAVASMANRLHSIDADHLTWNMESVSIKSVQVETRSTLSSEDNVTLTCQTDFHTHSGGHLGGLTFNEGGQMIGPVEQVGLWADQALFDVPLAGQSRRQAYSWSAPEGPRLPELLADQRARGWLAEGLTRLYIVEGLITKFGGHFDHLEIGPATAKTVRVVARFSPDCIDGRQAEISGLVRLG